MVGDILQPTHLLFVLVVALLVLGPKRLPEVGRSLGRGLRDFRAALSGEEVEHHDEVMPATSTDPSRPAIDDAQPEPVHDIEGTTVPDDHATSVDKDTIPPTEAHAAPAHATPETAERATPEPAKHAS